MSKIAQDGIIREMTTEEQAKFDAITSLHTKSDITELDRHLAILRQKRNRLLAETDYLALSDNTLSDDMRTYRQALRDLPAGKDTVEKCENATWPTKP